MTSLVCCKPERTNAVRWRAAAGPLRLWPLFGLLFLLTGCGLFQAPLNYRGQSVTQDELKQLVPGTTTEADVTALLGTPTGKGLFDPNRWSYMGQITQSRVGRFPGVRGQDVVVLTFNDQGVLEKVEHISQKQAVQVSMAAGATPSPGGSASFFQQLIGNVGRYSPTPLPNSAAGGGLQGGMPQQGALP